MLLLAVKPRPCPVSCKIRETSTPPIPTLCVSNAFNPEHASERRYDAFGGVPLFLQDPARMTTSGSAVHHKIVLNEIWHFAEYIVDEVESHDIPTPPITFEDESRWDGTVPA